MYKSNTPHIVVIIDEQFKITGMSEIVEDYVRISSKETDKINLSILKKESDISYYVMTQVLLCSFVVSLKNVKVIRDEI